MSNSVLAGLELAIRDIEEQIADLKARRKELKKLKNRLNKKGEDEND